jgi:hypothetical protein
LVQSYSTKHLGLDICPRCATHTNMALTSAFWSGMLRLKRAAGGGPWRTATVGGLSKDDYQA